MHCVLCCGVGVDLFEQSAKAQRNNSTRTLLVCGFQNAHRVCFASASLAVCQHCSVSTLVRNVTIELQQKLVNYENDCIADLQHPINQP